MWDGQSGITAAAPAMNLPADGFHHDGDPTCPESSSQALMRTLPHEASSSNSFRVGLDVCGTIKAEGGGKFSVESDGYDYSWNLNVDFAWVYPMFHPANGAAG